jgi:hypothetical protein
MPGILPGATFRVSMSGGEMVEAGQLQVEQAIGLVDRPQTRPGALSLGRALLRCAAARRSTPQSAAN